MIWNVSIVTVKCGLYLFIFFYSEQGRGLFGGPRSEYQELGLLAQTHYAHCLHH